MLKRPCAAVIAIVSTLVATASPARDEQEASPPPEGYRALMECRNISDATARLACFDRQSAAFDAAIAARDIVISDRNALKTARRGLFGFAAPVGRLMGFGGDEDDADQIKEVSSTVTQASKGADGWRLGLGDGSTWEQNDTRDYVLSPKIGDPVKVTRGALGTFFVSVKSQRALRMRRVK